MAALTQRHRTVLVTGANGYIGQAVALAFKEAGYATYGLVRSSQSATLLREQSIIPIVGSAADSQAIVSAMRLHTTILDTIVSTTDDRTAYVSHFNDTVALFNALTEVSNDAGVRPLVLFTSGSKDYGRGELDGSPDLLPHTEESLLRPPMFLADRATCAMKILEETAFDPAVVRPTNVHGRSSSLMGAFFEMAAEAKRNGVALCFRSSPRVIVHSMHIDDCAAAYVALANHQSRDDIAGNCFNISAGRKYETLRDIGEALVKAYGIEGGVEFDSLTSESGSDLLTDWSQWIWSDKIRDLTDWEDHQPMFAEGISKYKQEYEDAVRSKDDHVARVQAALKRIGRSGTA